jgi:hypothetical protein
MLLWWICSFHSHAVFLSRIPVIPFHNIFTYSALISALCTIICLAVNWDRCIKYITLLNMLTWFNWFLHDTFSKKAASIYSVVLCTSTVLALLCMEFHQFWLWHGDLNRISTSIWTISQLQSQFYVAIILHKMRKWTHHSVENVVCVVCMQISYMGWTCDPILIYLNKK